MPNSISNIFFLFQNMIVKGMKKVVKDPELAEKLVPKYPVGCKRITPSDTYLKVPYIKSSYLKIACLIIP